MNIGCEEIQYDFQCELDDYNIVDTKKHLSIFRAGGVVMLILAFTVPVSLFLGFLGALGKASRWPVISQICTIYVIMVRGIPDIKKVFIQLLLFFKLKLLTKGIKFSL